MTRASIVTVALALGPGAALACVVDAYEPGEAIPQPRFGADCSFDIPNQLTPGAGFQATAPVDIGGGRIGKRATHLSPCGYDEEIWIVDCNSGERLSISGQPSDDVYHSRRADLLYPPAGALQLSPETTVPDLTALATREGYSYSTDLAGRLRVLAPSVLPDPACGCRIFYPASALATQ